LLIFIPILTTTNSAAVSAVVNKSNTAEISKSQVKNMFLGKLGQFNDGTQAMPPFLNLMK
jgi:hypothetical protein